MIHELLQELRRRGIQVRTGDSGPEVVAPPGALTAQLRGALLAHRDALIALLERTSVPETLLVPRPEARLEAFPLTDIQHAYWIGLTNAFALGGYTTHFYFELDGHGIDPDRLQKAIDRVVGRHDMLRAVVQPDGRQRILGEVPSFPLVVHDLRNLAPFEERSRLEDIRADMDHQVLDPGQWPMFDLRLSLRSDGRTRLHVSLSLLVLDAYSIDIVFGELRRYYEDPGRPANPADVTFRDFVQHDLATRDDPSYRAASDYWSTRAGSLPPAPAIPLTRRPAEITEARFTRHRSTVEPDLWTTICSRARERGLTPSALLLAVFSDILRLWCRQDTFTLNLTLFNRPPVHPQIDQIVGDFTSLVLLEVPVAAADSSFLDRARAVQAQLLDDLEHVRYSGIQVMRDRAQARSTADVTMPVVFTSALGITDSSPSATSFFGRYGYGLSQTPHVWLDHQVFVDEGRLVSNWDAVDGLFPPGLVPQMASAFEQAVRSLAGHADAWSAKRLFEPVPADVLAQRRGVNTTGAPWPTRTLGDLVEESVTRNPNHLAVWDAGEEHSYAELARDARRVARRLQQLGARPGELVAVVADKGYAPGRRRSGRRVVGRGIPADRRGVAGRPVRALCWPRAAAGSSSRPTRSRGSGTSATARSSRRRTRRCAPCRRIP